VAGGSRKSRRPSKAKDLPLLRPLRLRRHLVVHVGQLYNILWRLRRYSRRDAELGGRRLERVGDLVRPKILHFSGHCVSDDTWWVVHVGQLLNILWRLLRWRRRDAELDGRRLGFESLCGIVALLPQRLLIRRVIRVGRAIIKKIPTLRVVCWPRRIQRQGPSHGLCTPASATGPVLL
jgi:hypothetical protein